MENSALHLLRIIVEGGEGHSLALLGAVVVGTPQRVLVEIVEGQEAVVVHLVDPLVAVHQLGVQRLPVLGSLLRQVSRVPQRVGRGWNLQSIYQLLHLTASGFISFPGPFEWFSVTYRNCELMAPNLSWKSCTNLFRLSSPPSPSVPSARCSKHCLTLDRRFFTAVRVEFSLSITMIAVRQNKCLRFSFGNANRDGRLEMTDSGRWWHENNITLSIN